MIKQILETIKSNLFVPFKPYKNGYLLEISGHKIKITDFNQGFLILSRIFRMEKEKNNEELFLYLMRANFLYQGTGDFTLCIDEKEEHIIFKGTSVCEINYISVKDILEKFVNYLDYWKSELSKIENRQL